MEILKNILAALLEPAKDTNENVDVMKFNGRTHIDMSNGEYTDVTNPHGVKMDSDHWL